MSLLHTLSQPELDKLLESADGPHVSVYLPTHTAGSDTRQDPIRFRNLLKEVRQQLADRFEMGSSKVESLLGLAADVETGNENDDFWSQQQQGLALFAHKGHSSLLALPATCDEFVFVGDHFHITPLLPLLQRDAQFYVLSVQLGETHLYRATRHSMEQLDGDDRELTMPESSLRPKDTSRLNFHSFRQRQQGGDSAAIHHGHEEADLEEQVLRYLREIDEVVTSHLSAPDVPLIFAGTDALFPLYSEINTHRQLAAQCVEGNPQGFSEEQLREKSWEIAGEQIGKIRQQTIDDFHQAKSADRAATDLSAVLREATHGLVETLLVERGHHCWGSWDENALTAETNDARQPDDCDLFNLAAIKTLQTGGSVFAFSGDDLPGGTTIAAILRHQVSRESQSKKAETTKK